MPPGRWLAEARRHFRATDQGLDITYDPALATAFHAALQAGAGDLWALFDACAGLPLAALRGDASDLLSPATFDEMIRRRPDMLAAIVPGRGHIPFLDEPASLRVIHGWLGMCL